MAPDLIRSTPVTVASEIADRLRDRILADLHAARLDPGDRLPSIRAVAREAGADHRTAARAYRTLEEEGLVEIRPRSGVFVAPQDHLGDGGMLVETADWLAGVAHGAWTRRIPLETMPDLLHRAIGAPLRAALVESVGDTRALLAREMTEDFGLEVDPIPVSEAYDALPPDEADRVREALEPADLAATTVFHAQAVQALARPLEVPVVVLRFSRRVVGEIRRRIEAARAAFVVALDPATGRRLGDQIDLAEDRIRVVPADDWDGTVPEGFTAWCTISAAERLGEDAPPPLGLPGASLSSGSAETLCRMIVRANLAAAEG